MQFTITEKKFPIYKLVALLVLLFLSPALSAQSPHFRKHSLPQQYSSYGITAIEQVSQHFIWFGTTNGVFRFNGIEYTHLLQDSTGSNHVTALYEDRSGKLWVGYKSGKIGVIENGKFVPFSPEEGFPAVAVTDFAEDRNILWFSTYGEGVYCLKEGRLYNFNTDDGLNDNYVYTLESEDNKRVWAGTDAGIGICSFDNGKKNIVKLTASDSLPDNIITALAYSNGSMWIGTESMGVTRYDRSTGNFTSLTHEWKQGAVTCIKAFDKNIWAGTASGIIEMSDTCKAFIHLPSAASRISDITTDEEGNVWVAAGTSTAYSANRAFRFISEKNNTNAENIQALLRDRQGNIWYSTQQDVFRLKIGTDGSERLSHLYDKNEKINVISMYEDDHGMIWLGTFGQGVYYIDPAKQGETHLSQASGLVDNNVLSITGSGNDVWIATLGGVSRLTRNAAGGFSYTSYTSESGLGSNYIYDIFIDSRKRVWFATDGKGITVLQNGKFTNYSEKNGLASNVIYSVTEDNKGKIWFSTSNAGIYSFDDKTFTHYALEKGLRELSISSIIGDKHGNVLIVNRQGIDVLNTGTGSIFYHGAELGISEIDPNLNAYTIDHSGDIWLGTRKGIIRYCTNEAKMQQWPVTKINKVLVFLNETEAGDQHKFRHDQNHISFDYTGFWYHDPEEVTYRIRLEGYDREWIISKNRFVTYPNLPPGKYTFMLQASATSSFEGAPMITYDFVIKPPFYNTVWFYILVIIMLAGILYWYIKTRERKLRAAEALKKDKIEFQFETLKSQVNPHFLFNSFNTLIGVIEEDRDTAVEYVEKLSDFYRNILLQREKNAITLGEELRMMDDYYFLQKKRYKSNFTMNVNVPAEYLNDHIAPLTLQLLVENAVKHNIISRDKPLIIDIYIDNGYIIVKNNLQRKLHPEPSTGMGLSNIISRYRLLNQKEIRIEETGSHYIVAIPLLNKLQ
jgi:ligand-binding sensor domain-containing protein